MRRLGIFAALAAAAVGISAPASANNDLSDAERQGAQSPPSIDRSPANAGSLSVNHGRAGYSIPIELPPGGLVPSLALTYDGSRQESAFGAGWKLGYPSVRVRTSGRGGQPDFGVAVRYLGLTGEELVPLAQKSPDQDGDGKRETVYREERDTLFARYVELSGGGWRVDYPDGRKLTLGTTQQTRVARSGSPDHVAEWLPEVMRDPSGNEVTWTWATPAQATASAGTTALGSAERYLTGLRWGCTSCSTATTHQSLTITYAELPNHIFDIAAGFVRELELQATSIRTATVTGGNTKQVRQYALAYDSTGSRRLLHTVTVSGADGSAMPPITFGYTTGGAAATTTLASPPGGAITALSSGVATVDMDGDGWKDIADLSNVGVTARFYRNRGTSVAAFAGPVTDIDEAPPMNLVSGGTVSAEDALRRLKVDLFDLCSGLGCEAMLYRHAGTTGWLAGEPRGALPLSPNSDTLRTDLTGDGIVDLVDTAPCALGDPWIIHPDDGAGTFSAPAIELDAVTTPAHGAAMLCASDAGVLTGDVNGDGVADIVELEATLGGDLAHVFLGRGRRGFGLQPEDGGARGPELTYTVTSIGASPSPSSVFLADVSGDGLDDLVSIDPAADQVRAWIRLPGSGFVEQSAPVTQFITAVEGCRIADWNASGVPSILCSAGATSAGGWRLHTFSSQPVHLLSSVDNGQGLVTRLTYTTTARVAAAHAAANHAWTRHVATALPIVASSETDDGRGNIAVTSYDYADPHYEADEVLEHYGITGFRYVAARELSILETTPGNAATRIPDPQDAGVLTRTFFDVGENDYFQRGMVDCVETWPGDATPVEPTCDVQQQGPLLRVVQEHSSHTNDDGIVRVTVDAEERWVLEDGPAQAAARLRTEYDYDTYNNRVAERRYGIWSGAADDTGNDEQVTLTDYVRNTDDWLLRLPRSVIRGGLDTSGATPKPIALERTCFEYDDVSDLCADGYKGASDTSVERGLRTRTLAYTDDDLGDGVPGTMEVVSQVTYTAAGLPDVSTDAEGHQTDTDYDAAFGLFRSAVTIDPGGLGLVTTFEVSTRHGGVTRVTGPDGMITRTQYDDLGRVTKVAQPGDTLAAPTLTRSYQLGAPVSTVTEAAKDGTADGLVTVSEVDGAGRLLCKRREAAMGQQDILEQREHSGRGLAVLAYLPATASACDVASRTAGGRSTTRHHDVLAFDPLSRPLEVLHQPSGTRSSHAYRVLEEEVADEADNEALGPQEGTTRIYRSDGLRRVATVIERGDANGDGALDDIATAYEHDALMRPTRVTDPLGAVLFEARYDSRGRLVWSRRADQGELASAYDGNGRVTSSIDARGHVVSRTYDAAGRPLTVVSDDGVAPRTVTYHHDAHLLGGANTTTCRVRGRVGWVDDPSGRSAFCYDDRGRVTVEETTLDAYGPTALRTRSTWDSLGRRKTLTHPDLTKLTWSFGVDGRESGVSVSSPSGASQTLVSAARYDAAGNVTRLDYGNGAVVEVGYDDRLRATSHTATLGGLQLDLQLSLGHTGNVEAITDTLGSRSGTFVYDHWDRLVSATGAFVGGDVLHWSHDVRGNLIALGRTSATAPAVLDTLDYDDPQRVHAVTGVDRGDDGSVDEAFAYDLAGNVAEDGLRGFAFDADGKLASVESASGAPVVTHTYDYLGRHVTAAYADGDAVHWVRAANAELRHVGGTVVQRKLITFAGRTVASVEGTFTNANKASRISMYALDHLGGHPLVFDVANPAAVVERWASYPYGEDNLEPLDTDGQLADYLPATDPASKLSRRFQDREVDAQLPDLYDLGPRVYSARLGRFLSPDPVVPAADRLEAWNPYAFVYNNPLRYLDPSGHEPESATPAAGYELRNPIDVAVEAWEFMNRPPNMREYYQQQRQWQSFDDFVEKIPKVNVLRDLWVMGSGKDLTNTRVSEAEKEKSAWNVLVKGLAPPVPEAGRLKPVLKGLQKALVYTMKNKDELLPDGTLELRNFTEHAGEKVDGMTEHSPLRKWMDSWSEPQGLEPGPPQTPAP